MTESLYVAGMTAGGLGLLLIGMGLMTDGLKIAAGSTLRDILALSTGSRQRALLSGVLITAIVQSSSAVTVATIGFVNAGLLGFEQAVWVIFGSNVGTTMTAWIVALIGFKLDIEAIALPVIGAGAILRLTGQGTRRGALGHALIGFGLLFLGIAFLKTAFESFGSRFAIPVFGGGIVALGAYVLVGAALTTLMQSSSAALVVVLSAAQGGLISLQSAACLVIGANLGTTTTALMTVWDATPAAKRVALSHVLFNVLTAIVAIVILAPMLAAVDRVRDSLNLDASPATTLAVFHTVFNVLGVALMWPLAARMVRFLSGRFQSLEEIESRPKYLDRTILGLPFIAGEALANEADRVRELAAGAAAMSIRGEAIDPAALDERLHVARSLAAAVGEFAAALSQTQLPAAISDRLPDIVRSAQQSATVIDLAKQVIAEQAQVGSIADEDVNALLDEFVEELGRAIDAAALAARDPESADTGSRIRGVDERYGGLKEALLRHGVSGRIGVMQMDALLQYASLARRTAKQLVRASRRLGSARLDLSRGTSAAPGGIEARAAESAAEADEAGQ